MVGLRSLVLRSHVASTMHGRKGKCVFILDGVACYLAVNNVGLPSIGYRPV
jgi:hypothetical protein